VVFSSVASFTPEGSNRLEEAHSTNNTLDLRLPTLATTLTGSLCDCSPWRMEATGDQSPIRNFRRDASAVDRKGYHSFHFSGQQPGPGDDRNNGAFPGERLRFEDCLKSGEVARYKTASGPCRSSSVVIYHARFSSRRSGAIRLKQFIKPKGASSVGKMETPPQRNGLSKGEMP